MEVLLADFDAGPSSDDGFDLPTHTKGDVPVDVRMYAIGRYTAMMLSRGRLRNVQILQHDANAMLQLSTGELLGELLHTLLGQTNTLSTAQLVHHVAHALGHRAVPRRQAIVVTCCAQTHLASVVPSKWVLLGAKSVFNGCIQLLLADDEGPGVGVQVMQARLARLLLGGYSALVGAPPGLNVLVGSRQFAGKEVAHTLGDRGLGQGVDLAAGRHGQSGALLTALLYPGKVLCIGCDLAGVQLLHTLPQRLFPYVSQALVVQAEVGVGAEGPRRLAFLGVLGRLAQEVLRVLGMWVARLENVARNGQVTLELGLQREGGLLLFGDVDVVGRLGSQGERSGRRRQLAGVHTAGRRRCSPRSAER